MVLLIYLITNIIRKEEATCIGACIIGEISRFNYFKVLDIYFKSYLLADIKLFQSIDFIKGSTNTTIIKKLIKEFGSKKIAKMGEVIIHQDELIDNIYVIKSGSFSLSFVEKKKIENGLDINFFSNLKNSNDPNERFTGSRLHELKGYETIHDNYNVI